MRIRDLLGSLVLVPIASLSLALAGCGESTDPDVEFSGASGASGAAGAAGADTVRTADGALTAVGDLQVSGPHAHENLQIWLVHGPDRSPSDREVVPLEEALERGLAVVHETGDVNELAIENVSQDVDVYVQSGDIVQGGKQDRTIGVDLVLAAASGKVPLPSFCVEQGRWSPRGAQQAQIAQLLDAGAQQIGGQVQTVQTDVPVQSMGQGPVRVERRTGGEVTESADFAIPTATAFRSSQNAVATKSLKEAVLLQGDQGQVWQEVEIAQGMLASNVYAFGHAVDPISPTSLELTLNTDAVQKATSEYVDALRGILEGRDDVVGCVVAINGELDTADVYGSRALFRKLWPKLLRSASTAAVAHTKEGETSPEVASADVRAFLAEPEGSGRTRQVGGGTSMVLAESELSHVVESRSASAGSDRAGLLHRTYLSK